MIDEIIIENAKNVLLLIEQKVLTVEEVRKMLGLKDEKKDENKED